MCPCSKLVFWQLFPSQRRGNHAKDPLLIVYGYSLQSAQSPRSRVNALRTWLPPYVLDLVPQVATDYLGNAVLVMETMCLSIFQTHDAKNVNIWKYWNNWLCLPGFISMFDIFLHSAYCVLTPAVCVAFYVKLNMEPVSVLVKAEKLYCLEENECTKTQEAPLFFPPLLWSHTSHFISRNTVFQYKLEITFFKSVKCRRNYVSIECNYNDVLFVRWGGSLLFQVCYVVNIGFYLWASLKDSIEYLIIHFMSWDVFCCCWKIKDNCWWVSLQSG